MPFNIPDVDYMCSCGMLMRKEDKLRRMSHHVTYETGETPHEGIAMRNLMKIVQDNGIL